MKPTYSSEKNIQYLISHLKVRGVKNIIASPGTTNMNFVRSIQNDNFFNVYSCVDERSASYMAVGMAFELGEPVVITCTGATASVNYLPGITEAFHRKLPVIAITATQNLNKVGHNVAQVIDRSIFPSESYLSSFNLIEPLNQEDLWNLEIKLNKLFALAQQDGGGPVHINLETSYSNIFSEMSLPIARQINIFNSYSKFPEISFNKIAILISSTKKIDNDTTKAIEEFCQKYNAVVLCDHTSGYCGKYRIIQSLVSTQGKFYNELQPNLTIQIGEITGDYSATKYLANEIWKINEDGKIKDTYKKLTKLFRMREVDFFKFYNSLFEVNKITSFYESWLKIFSSLSNRLPELPFSNIWIAKETVNLLPLDSNLHLGILNSLRSWNFFDINNSIKSISNVGGFGIDGNLSTAIGSSLVNQEKKHFLVIGDLAFFYDLNSIGNREIRNNLKIILINNGVGTEFKNYNHRASASSNEADRFIAAKGHFGFKSKTLVKGISESLGFEYFFADSKKGYLDQVENFINSNQKSLFEVFTSDDLESRALELISNIDTDKSNKIKEQIKKMIR